MHLIPFPTLNSNWLSSSEYGPQGNGLPRGRKGDVLEPVNQILVFIDQFPAAVYEKYLRGMVIFFNSDQNTYQPVDW